MMNASSGVGITPPACRVGPEGTAEQAAGGRRRGRGVNPAMVCQKRHDSGGPIPLGSA